MSEETNPLKEPTAQQKFDNFLKYLTISQSIWDAEHRSEIISYFKLHVDNLLEDQRKNLLQYTTCATCCLKTALQLSATGWPICRECRNANESSSPIPT